MKLKTLRVFNSVKCGVGEFTFFTSKEFDMDLVDNLIYIKRIQCGSEVITPLTNTPYFTLEVVPTNGQSKGTKNTKGVLPSASK
jgi:hypothetical protein